MNWIVDEVGRIKLPEEALEALKIMHGDSISIRTLERDLYCLGSIEQIGLRLSEKDIDCLVDKERVAYACR
jgi:hypothetical protein